MAVSVAYTICMLALLICSTNGFHSPRNLRTQSQVCRFSTFSGLDSDSEAPRILVVAGATGRVGKLVVQQVLERPDMVNVKVRALTRSAQKAKTVLPAANDRLEIVQCDLNKQSDLQKSLRGASACIWCATGFSDGSNNIDKALGLFRLKFFPKEVLDIAGLSRVGSIFSKYLSSDSAAPQGIVDGGPQVVLCSSAGVTRTTWSKEKQKLLEGAADIPIVRLNPFGILDSKRQGEDALRGTGALYAVVRPCGLNDKWPRGRPVLAQGDVAVGRICRADVASLLIDTVLQPDAVGKTFEAIAMAGYPKPRSLENQLQRLQYDADGPLDEEAVVAAYSIMQQLVPGESMQPNDLAMGQTYEQLDAGETGRLGVRGTEQAPISPSA